MACIRKVCWLFLFILKRLSLCRCPCSLFTCFTVLLTDYSSGENHVFLQCLLACYSPLLAALLGLFSSPSDAKLLRTTSFLGKILCRNWNRTHNLSALPLMDHQARQYNSVSKNIILVTFALKVQILA